MPCFVEPYFYRQAALFKLIQITVPGKRSEARSLILRLSGVIATPFLVTSRISAQSGVNGNTVTKDIDNAFRKYPMAANGEQFT